MTLTDLLCVQEVIDGLSSATHRVGSGIAQAAADEISRIKDALQLPSGKTLLPSISVILWMQLCLIWPALATWKDACSKVALQACLVAMIYYYE